MSGWPSKQRKQSTPKAPAISCFIYIPHNNRDALPQGADTVLMDASGRVYHEPGVYVFDPADVFDSNWPPDMTLEERQAYSTRNAEASARARHHHNELQQEIRRQEELRRAEIASQATEPDTLQDNPAPRTPRWSLS